MTLELEWEERSGAWAKKTEIEWEEGLAMMMATPKVTTKDATKYY
jgi:hypothetical protein